MLIWGLLVSGIRANAVAVGASGATTDEVILVTGAAGQIGSELVFALREKHGAQNVVASGRSTPPSASLRAGGPWHTVDVLNRTHIESVFAQYPFTQVYHMAAILSGVGEQKPALAWDVNMNGLINLLDVAKEPRASAGGMKIMVPSSIAAFGPDAPPSAPQDTPMHPTSMYGVTKVAGELLSGYYASKFGLDIRGVRLPGIISAETLPGGGTTDYSVEIFYEAIKNPGKPYKCFLSADTKLPMMYMPDALESMIGLMAADKSRFAWPHATCYNVNGFVLTPAQLAAAIKQHLPTFEITYEPDFRQAIADSWPDSMDDSAARKEWDWNPIFGVEEMTTDMLQKLQERHAKIGL